jgi:hypothetical protein
MQVLRAALLYFGVVFGAGFMLGVIRTVWVARRVSARTAELMEAPLMLVVTIIAGRWIVVRFAVPATASVRLEMGAIALGLMLLAEFGLVAWLRGISIKTYFATRDPVSGTVYYALLAVFAIPLLLTAG